MKQLLKPLIIALMAIALAMPAMAQSDDNKRMTREELATKQAKYIAKELALDQATTDKYVETYCKHQQEVWALGSRKGLTTEQRLDLSQKVLDLRKKYHTVYSTFLTEPQLEKSYKLEKRLHDRMHKHKGERPKGKQHKHPRKQ